MKTHPTPLDRQALQTMFETPRVPVGELRDTAWGVLGDVLFEEDKAAAALLLPDAFQLMQRIVDIPWQQANPSNAYFAARIALANRGVFEDLAYDRPISDSTRTLAISGLTQFIADMTDGTYDVHELPPRPRHRAYIALANALLQRSTEGAFGVPSPPYTHYNYHDSDRQLTSHQLYAIGYDSNNRAKSTPLDVALRSNSDHAQTQGALVLQLGRHLFDIARRMPGISEHVTWQGGAMEATRRTVSFTAKMLSTEHTNATQFLEMAANRIASLTMQFDPAQTHYSSPRRTP